MKIKKITCIIIALAFGACNADTSTFFGLTIEDAFFATVNNEGFLVPIESNIFNPGDDINIGLLNVSGFKKGDDGLNSFEMEMEVYDEENNLILSLGDLLGESGHINLENNTAESAYASLTNTENLKPGKYKLILAIYDKIGGGTASQSKTFIIE